MKISGPYATVWHKLTFVNAPKATLSSPTAVFLVVVFEISIFEPQECLLFNHEGGGGDF